MITLPSNFDAAAFAADIASIMLPFIPIVLIFVALRHVFKSRRAAERA
jgi:hypothetical protein